MVYLHRTLSDQKKSSEPKDQVFTAKALVVVEQKIGWDREQGFCELNDPGDAQQEEDPYHHGEQQARVPRPFPELFRKFIRRNGNKDDVVNSQNDLKKTQRE